MVQRIESPKEVFPSNIVVLATHGGYFVPDSVRRKLSDKITALGLRGVKNFSDFGSRWVVKDVPNDQKVVAGFSRAIGDPNRSLDAPDLFRDTDFNGNQVWETPLTDHEKTQLLEGHYKKYHSAVLNAIESAESTSQRVIVFDVHDTGNLMLATDPNNDTERAEAFPSICLGNKDGESCDPAIMNDFASLIEKHLGITPLLNHPYKGGYVTSKYGKEYNDSLPLDERFKRNVIQVELGRYLYMDEKTQKIDFKKLQSIKSGLNAAMKELGEKYDEE